MRGHVAVLWENIERGRGRDGIDCVDATAGAAAEFGGQRESLAAVAKEHHAVVVVFPCGSAEGG